MPLSSKDEFYYCSSSQGCYIDFIKLFSSSDVISIDVIAELAVRVNVFHNSIMCKMIVV